MNRANLFVAAESILLAAFTAVPLVRGYSDLLTLIPLGLAGSGITICWLGASIFQLNGVIGPLRSELANNDPLYKRIKKFHQHHPTSWAIGFLPVLLLDTWLWLLLTLHFPYPPNLLPIEVVIVATLTSILAYMYVDITCKLKQMMRKIQKLIG